MELWLALQRRPSPLYSIPAAKEFQAGSNGIAFPADSTTSRMGSSVFDPGADTKLTRSFSAIAVNLISKLCALTLELSAAALLMRSLSKILLKVINSCPDRLVCQQPLTFSFSVNYDHRHRNASATRFCTLGSANVFNLNNFIQVVET